MSKHIIKKLFLHAWSYPINMDLTKLSSVSKELDIDGNKISDTNYPSQWAIAYAIMRARNQSNTTEATTFNEYVFEGTLVQFLDKAIQTGEIVTTWDEKDQEFKYASSLKLKNSKEYDFISLKEIFSQTVSKFV
jgi:hypothetical protein